MRVLVAIGLSAFVGGCGAPALHGTAATADALAQDVLAALETSDRHRLLALALDEGEFKAHVWPSLPAARPERNLPFSYVWMDLRQKSQMSLSRTIGRYGGRRFQLVRVRTAPPTEYPAFRVHPKAVFVVRHPSGTDEDLRACGSLLEKDGRWKVVSYVVDD